MGRKRSAAAAADEARNADDIELEAERLEAAAAKKSKALAALRKLAAEERRLGVAADPEDDEPAVLPGDQKLAQVVAELDGTGSVSVTKLEGDKTISVGNFDLKYWPEAVDEAVKAFGDGTYLYIVHDENGQMVTRAKRTIRIAGQHAAAAGSLGADPLRFVEMIDKANARAAQQLETMRLEQQKMLLEILKSNSVSPLAQMKEFLELQRAIAPKENGLKDLVSTIDLVDRIRGDDGGNDAPAPIQTNSALVALVDRVASVVMLALAKKPAEDPAKPAPAGAAAAALPPGKTAAAAAAPPEEDPAGAEESELERARRVQAPSLITYLPVLAAAIANGMTADIAAEKAWQNAAMNGELLNMKLLLEHGDWDGLKADPAVKDHGQWIDAFRARLCEIAAPPKAK